MPAAGQADAKVLVKRGADEGVKIEAGEGESCHCYLVIPGLTRDRWPICRT